MKRLLKGPWHFHVARIALAWGFIGLGVLGVLLPILPGVVFLAIGVLMLAPYSRACRWVTVVLKRRVPLFRKGVREAKKRGLPLS